MHDLALLRDLKDAANLVITRAQSRDNRIDAAFLASLNATMTRSASIQPGALRLDRENIGVNTKFGRHEPPAVTAQQLDLKIQKVLTEEDIEYRAAKLFLIVAKAQPFKDGNKRTGIFAANALLFLESAGVMLKKVK